MPQPPLQITFRRNIEESSASTVLPIAVKTLQSVKPELQEEFCALVRARLAAELPNSILRSLLLISPASDTEATEVSACE